VVFFVTILSGCRGKGDQKTAEHVVALVVKTLNHPFFIDMQKGAEQAAVGTGVRLMVQGPEREIDVEKQMQIIENLIQRRVSALCIAPCGSREIVPAVVKANQAGIPVLIIDTRVDSVTLAESGGRIETFIGSDNYQGGRLAGEFIVEKLGGKGEVAVLEGIPGHETGDARKSGFHDVLDGVPGMEVTASLTANWERDQGYMVFQNILQSHPDVDALFACNDLMALGAAEAISMAGKKGQILVIGFDALEDARHAILRGEMDATIAQHPFEMGRRAVQSAHEILQGKRIPPEIPVEIELVTRDKL
jgi:ribose transport system substrate-binding protein